MTVSDFKYGLSDESALIVWRPARRLDLEDRYDWETFYHEVIRLAHGKRGAPLDAVELQDHMRHWCLLTWRRCPTEALLRDKLEPISRKLEGSGKLSRWPADGGDKPAKKASKHCEFFFAPEA